MRWFGRIIKWSIPLALIASAVFWPLLITGSSSAGPADDPVTFSNYRAEYFVDRDGNLDATETVTAEFPSGRHGLFRYWDVTNQNSPHVRQPPEITSITLDGEPADYQLLWEDGERFRVAKIGDPDRYLGYGTHVFEIRYTIAGVLDPGSTGVSRTFATADGDVTGVPSVFFWNAVAPGWGNRIDQAQISVSVPGGVTGAQCAVGYGTGNPCEDLVIDGDTMTVTATDLPPRTPVTVRVGVDVPTPPRSELPWSYAWDGILGRSASGLAWVAALTVAGALISVGMFRMTVEKAPGFPLQYAPPALLGPVQFEYIRTESVPKNGLTATLFYLAERDLVELHQESETKWAVHGRAARGEWASVDPVSVAVGSALKVMTPGTEFDANGTVTAGKKLTTAKTDMAAAVQKWASDDGLLVKRRGELWVRAANVLALVLTVMATFGWGSPPRSGSCRSRCSSSCQHARGGTGWGPGARRPVANCGRRQADSTACCALTRQGRGSTSVPARTSTPPMFRSRSLRVRPRCGRRSTRRRRECLRPNRSGTTRRAAIRPSLGVPVRTSTVSNRR